ncbi:hypothetical protein J2X12_004198 [Pseudarthrobacter oxydans]|uniref:Uncharacterized protein n=1 Tax=Pseudarthrobacter oxydans TaxID=1671 RepID=A0AAW8NHU9_PSEOX|nr:hypothetical protein [Pseudarthrobacter oxydans]MDR6794766.1 hypothetical protein [Pseudarthrobacter oxydans]MDR7166144.1 hypothetical protein [Pseudarthrobacter oxydans]
MRQKPKSYADSFWGDLVNALTLRPVYRPPVEALVTTATVTFQSPTAEQTTASQQATAEQSAAADDAVVEAHAIATVRKAAVDAAMGEEATSTAQSTANAGSMAKSKADAVPSMQEKSNPSTTAQEKSHAGTTVSETRLQYLPKNAIPLTSQQNLGSFLRSTETKPHAFSFTKSTFAERSTGDFVRSGERSAETPANRGSLLPPSSEKYQIFPSFGASPAVDKVLATAYGASIPTEKEPESGKDQPQTTYALRNPAPRFGILGRISRSKLKAAELKELGFSSQEAQVIEGMFRGKKIRTIASGMKVPPAHVLNISRQLMVKVGVNNARGLLTKVKSMHGEWEQKNTMIVAGVRLKLSKQTVRDGIVVVNDNAFPTIINRPPDIRIPAGHPDHPANDEGGNKGVGQQHKRTPAHSADTPPSRKPE